MAGNEDKLKAMLIAVAKALGDELLAHVAFVGGSTTALFLTDPVSREGVRYTQDVDLIVDVADKGQWAQLQGKLRARGFTVSPEDEVICRMRLGALKVDFMPRDGAVLGFTNRWYHQALLTSRPYPLDAAVSVNLLTPAYFLATKLEAWRGRGNNDPLSSHDLEDIINLVDGREELLDELTQAEEDVRRYIAEQFEQLLRHPGFPYAVTGNIADPQRAELVMQRFETIIKQNKRD
jgi:predicted nucleotidyltransferase